MSSLKRFARLVADEWGGKVVSRKGHIELNLKGEPQVTIQLGGETARVSQDRLRLIEKQAAIALLSDSASFSITVSDDAWKRMRKATLVRVAFGLYIVNGAPRFQRYTAYCERGSNMCAMLVGDDSLFSKTVELAEQESEVIEIKETWFRICSLFHSAYKHFTNGNPQVQQFEALGKRERECLFDLNLFYGRKSKQHVRTYGVDLSDCMPNRHYTMVFSTECEEQKNLEPHLLFLSEMK